MNLLVSALSTGTTVTISTITDAITTVFTWILGLVTTVVSTITGNPVLFFLFVIPFAGIGISIFLRLTKAAKGA